MWQGDFPIPNTGADGFKATTPAKSFRPNGIVLYNMVGNVWHWNREDFSLDARSLGAKTQSKKLIRQKLANDCSFLCPRGNCHRYRIAARIGNSPCGSTTHTPVFA
ncbi:MAG: hypothetical protein CMM73_02240 [Rhodospirillaceae bacterium]|nr:hypothetical protein [Rhodospirillaceae bacterium]